MQRALHQRDVIHDALADAYLIIREAAEQTHDEAWNSPTACPSWDIRAQISHVLGTELMLLGEPMPEIMPDGPEHVRNDIGRLNEAWISSLADVPIDDIRKKLAATVTARLEAITQLSDEEWNAETITPGGPGTVGRLLEFRVFDMVLHADDIHDAAGHPPLGVRAPSSPALALAVAHALHPLPWAVGKRAGFTDGQGLRLILTDAPSAPIAHSIVVRDGRAEVVDELSDPTVRITTDRYGLLRLIGGRYDGFDQLAEIMTVEGEPEVARRLTDALAYTP